MADLTAQRTLVKSPPELWSELSEVESLARHLGELGEIRIVKVEPESTVAWEGEQVSGTVELEQSGWGTKVTFRATVPEPGPAPEPVDRAPLAAEPEPQPDEIAPEPDPEPAETELPQPKQGFLARWLFRRRQPPPEQAVAAEQPKLEPVPDVEPEPEPELTPAAVAPDPPATTAAAERVQEVLDGTLEALGQAHHRPFSRG